MDGQAALVEQFFPSPKSDDYQRLSHGTENGNGSVTVPRSTWQPSLVVFSGGSGFNNLCQAVHEKFTTRVTHVLPISDDGGSTSEIVRVLGGPAVGDIRSRCLRLSDESCAEAIAVKKLLGHRLVPDDQEAKAEWYRIVEGEHELWESVSDPYKHTIRAFLSYFNAQILRHTTKRFSFSNGSVGNFFFAGARVFFGSLDAAIFLYSRVSGIPNQSRVLPAVSSNEHVMLGAELCNGRLICGQSAISHPIESTSPGAHTAQVDKHAHGALAPMDAPVRRILYLSATGAEREHEIFPAVHSEVLARMQDMSALVYGCGSLYTSICPSLILNGVGEAIAMRQTPKILLLNGCSDRETAGMSGQDVIQAITDALNRTHSVRISSSLTNPASAYITTVMSPENGAFGDTLDASDLAAKGIEVIHVKADRDSHGQSVYNPNALAEAIKNVVQSYRYKKPGSFPPENCAPNGVDGLTVTVEDAIEDLYM